MYLSIILFFISLLFTLPLDVIDIDSSQYAEIAREMVDTGNYLFLRDNGKPYLDKPILTFWKIALSYKIFGISNFAYRIPSLVFLVLSAISLYKLSFLVLEDKAKAYFSTIIYLSSPGIYAMVLDPKIDIFLVSYLIFIHHAYFLGVKKNSNWFYLMYIFIGLGFITKGPISMVVPAISIGGDILLRRDWKLLKEIHLLSGTLLISIFPMFWSYILYQDFKSYGPYFFLWIQSFGKITGQGRHVNSINPGFFISNFGWIFFTFLLPLLYSFYVSAKNSFTKETISNFILKIKLNLFSSSAFVIPFWFLLFFSLLLLSKFQLPQYLYWIVPAASIYCADKIHNLINQNLKVNYILFLFAPMIYFMIVAYYPFVATNIGISYYMLFILFLGISIFIFSIKWFIVHSNEKLVVIPFIAYILLIMDINLFAYPELLKYQPSKQIAHLLLKMEPNQKEFYTYRLSSSKRSYNFYLGRLKKTVYDKNKFQQTLERDKFRLVVVPSNYLPQMKEYLGEEYTVELLKEFYSYKVATPSAKFLDPKNREGLSTKIAVTKVRAF